MMARLKIIVVVFVILSLTVSAKPDVYVSTECYGNALSLSCEANHRIKVIDDFFGVSTAGHPADTCQYHPGDCTVTNNRYTSLVHRFCEGKKTCTNFQVDRRYCGLNHTNYEQVEYQCIPETEVIDMCSASSVSTWNGYLSTPNFPNEYPPSQHCVCTLWTAPQHVKIKLEATHFVVKFDHPCQDWIEIDSGTRTRRICGAYRSTIISDFFQLAFHSDSLQGHQGAWMYFSVYPEIRNVSIHVTCRPEKYIPKQKKISTNNLSTVSTTMKDEDIILSHEVAKEIEAKEINILNENFGYTTSAILVDNNNNPVTAAVSPFVTSQSQFVFTTAKSKTEGVILNTHQNIQLSKAEPKIGDKDKIQTGNSNKWKEMTKTNSIKVIDKPMNPIVFYENNVNQKKLIHAGLYLPTTTERYNKLILKPSQDISTRNFRQYINARRNNTGRGINGAHSASFIVESISKNDGDDGINDEKKNKAVSSSDTDISGMGSLFSSPFHNKHITGIIIISICVGGIVVLVIVLSVLLCINKSKKPKRSLRRQRRKNERLQQRLNTLSFYDSIPLYDSLGRTGGVARAPPGLPRQPLSSDQETMNASSDLDITISTIQPTSQPHRHHQPVARQGPYWTTLHRQPPPTTDIEFDSSMYIDSSLYASLNRSFTSVTDMRANGTSRESLSQSNHHHHNETATTTTETVHQSGDKSPAVNLAYDCADEDICTHV